MKVAVIGAGASGLAAIKCCIDEGLDVVCYERTNYISGLWHYTDDVEEGQACVMKSTVINTTKETMCYSDFPIPKEFAMFMHNKEVDKYFHMYADAFGLKKKIIFNTEVLSARKSNNFSKTGQWVLEIHDKTTGSKVEHIYDAVLVCTGHHAEKNMASFPRMDEFKGSIIHSHDYKDGSPYEDKRLVVVGIGNSGGDIAVESSRISSQVFLSTRSGAYIFHRIEDRGVPVSFVLAKRYLKTLTQWFPYIVFKRRFERLNKRFDHSMYGLLPRKPGAQHPTVNDDLPNRIATGTIKMKPNIAEFMPTSVRFDDGSVEEVDDVILATGYIFGFPFLDKTVVDVVDNKIRLYKFMFPTTVERNTLAIIGCIQPLGAIMPISEQQCRLATRVFKMFFTDPRLAIECYFGPATPYQYRLEGPGAWTGAREAIMAQWDRTFYPLCGDSKADKQRPGSRKGLKLFIGLCLVSVGPVIYWNYAQGTNLLGHLADRGLHLIKFK